VTICGKNFFLFFDCFSSAFICGKKIFLSFLIVSYLRSSAFICGKKIFLSFLIVSYLRWKKIRPASGQADRRLSHFEVPEWHDPEFRAGMNRAPYRGTSGESEQPKDPL